MTKNKNVIAVVAHNYCHGSRLVLPLHRMFRGSDTAVPQESVGVAKFEIDLKLDNLNSAVESRDGRADHCVNLLRTVGSHFQL